MCCREELPLMIRSVVQYTGNMNTLLAIQDPSSITTIGAVLAALGVVWRLFITKAKEDADRSNKIQQENDERAKKNEAKLEETSAKLFDMMGKVGKLEGQVELTKQIDPKIDEIRDNQAAMQEISEQMLERLKSADS